MEWEEHELSEWGELGIGLGVCCLIAGVIILRLLIVGPMGSNTAASHAGAGLGEIILILAVFSLGITVTFTRLVYRVWPVRRLKVASVVYVVLLLLWIGLEFIEVGGLLMLALQLFVGLIASVLLMIVRLVAGPWGEDG